MSKLLDEIRQEHIEDCHARALAMDLQFDIDVASALVHAHDARDAARWRQAVKLADFTADGNASYGNGNELTAFIDAAMKANNEN